MESKYHAIAFLVVLAIVCLGAYVAVNAILSAGRTPLISLATSTPTRLAIPGGDQTMVAPGSIPTNTPVVPPTPAVPTATPVLPTPTPTANPATPTRPVAATPTSTETPGELTPIPPGEYQYMPGGPVRSECGRPSALIYGWVRDAQDENLEGVRIRVSDQWENIAEAISKGGNEAGYYDIVRGMETVTWWLVVVDEAGNPLSPVVTIEPAQGAASCWYQLDWQRTY